MGGPVDEIVDDPFDLVPLEDEDDFTRREKHALSLKPGRAQVKRGSGGQELPGPFFGAGLQASDDCDAFHSVPLSWLLASDLGTCTEVRLPRVDLQSGRSPSSRRPDSAGLESSRLAHAEAETSDAPVKIGAATAKAQASNPAGEVAVIVDELALVAGPVD